MVSHGSDAHGVIGTKKKKHIVILFNVYCFLLDDFTKYDATRVRLAALRINLMTQSVLLRHAPMQLSDFSSYYLHNA
jgi:hypothetical protein